MKFITAKSLNNDSMRIYISESSSSENAKGVIHIYHGLAEHFGRYTETRKHFNSLGYHVVGIDHRGHGHWINSGALPGYFSDNDGWNVVLNDMEASFKTIESHYDNLPHYILAHSMGSWLTLSFLQRDINPTKVILSASSKLSTSLLGIQKLLIKCIKLFKGGKSPSGMSNILTTEKFNSFFKPNRTTHDWLSSNDSSVDEYIDSPLCGFIPTNQMYEDIADGVITTFSTEQMKLLNPDLPILLIAGTEDPVGDQGKGVEALFSFLNEYVHSVEIVLLEGFRHEILNEVDKNKTYEEIIRFIQK